MTLRILSTVPMVLAVALIPLSLQAQNKLPGERQLRISREAETVTISDGARTVLRYRFAGVPFKPYVQELSTPQGANVLLDAPPDHLHHHGLMFAIIAGGVNFWEETERAGKQEHRTFGAVYPSADKHDATAGFDERIAWLDRGGQLLLLENRAIRIHGNRNIAEAGVTLLTWQSQLQLPHGADEIQLTGNHYHGLGMRFPREMDSAGRFSNSENAEGTVFRGQERLTPARWCAYTSTLQSRPVTVAMFDSPANVRHPATWFTMREPFAYLSATMRWHVEPLVLSSASPRVFSYGVALWDGMPAAEAIDRMSRLWIAALGSDTITNKD